ncbi:MAG: hypothetical protein H0V48_04360 [Nocardioidaceae bacterium]|nr:hypothetical protein [Nocardioidaceae bacterium]
MLLGRFSVQFVVSVTASAGTNQLVIVILSIGYGALAVAELVRLRGHGWRTLKDGMVTPFPRLESDAGRLEAEHE